MSSAGVKLGLVGFGTMGRAHAEQLRYIEVRSCSVIDECTRRSAAQEFYQGTGVRVLSEIDQVSSNSEISGWIVASSTSSHIPITSKLLEAGSTVLLEKPLANTLDEAQRLQSLVRADSTNLMLGHILLWHREFRAFRKELSKLGKLLAINASRQRSQDHRVKYPSESPFTLTMIHDLYTIYALVEGAMPVSMTAQQREHEAGGVDLALAQMKWGDGSLAHLQANFLIPDGIAGGGNIDELSAACVGGVLRLTYESGNLTVFREGKSTQIPIELPRSAGIASYFDDALRGELRAFIDLINGDASIPVGARYRDACVIQEWIENFKKSAESEVA